MSPAPIRMQLVQLWCARCREYVTYEGAVYETRADAPVHVTPEVLRAHRVKVGHP